MAKIWEYNFWYSILRPYIDWCTRRSFSKVTVTGLDNVPNDGALILAPNHCNTLMDALLVLQSDRKASAYGARADMFRNPKAASALRWLKILPIARKHDGVEAIANNLVIFDEIVDCIDHKVPFCIFSEGTHRPKHSLLPIKKGIFRIAVKAANDLGKKIYVVPVGLDYADYFRYMMPVRVNFGQPIEVNADDDPAELTQVLQERLSNLITYFPDDENYDSNWAEYVRTHRRPLNPLKAAVAVLALPVFILSAILSFPIYILSSIVVKKFKDKAWTNSVRMVCKTALLPLLTIIVAIPAFINMHWALALALLVFLWYSHSIFYYLLNVYTTILK